MKIKTLCIKTIPRKNINHNISKRDYKKHLYRACSEVCRGLIDFEERKRGLYCYTIKDATEEEINNIINNFKNIPFKYIMDCWVEW